MKALTLAFSLIAGGAMAQDINGLWQTEPGDTGGFLQVNIAPCGANTCGTIAHVFGADRKAAAGHEFQGKQIIWDMSPSGAGAWGGGKIWAPDRDKTYNSKMELVSDDLLKVSGCVLMICRGQTWQRVK